MIKFDPRSQPEYDEGAVAFDAVLSRADCPYESGCSESAGFNYKRQAWMLGHLDAEFEAKWGPKAGEDFRATAKK